MTEGAPGRDVCAPKQKHGRCTSGTAACLGGSGWIRTTEVVDNRFTVCPLWPLGNSPINYAILYKACPAFLSGRTAQFGAGERTRTPDLLITNQLLYQLSYTSISQCLDNISYLYNIVKHFFKILTIFLFIAYNNLR